MITFDLKSTTVDRQGGTPGHAAPPEELEYAHEAGIF